MLRSVDGGPPRDVMPRSDDGGPLEAVVLQMGERLTRMAADMQVLQNSDSQQSRDLQDALKGLQDAHRDIQDALSSSTFVHWGSSGCSNVSDLIYSGWVGGSHSVDAGAATNYLCLTASPVLSDHSVRAGNILASLWGAGYKTADSNTDLDPVCAVCRSTLPNTIMIPGTNVCTAGWRTQYTGFLKAGKWDQSAESEFICVDSKLESRPGGGSKEEGIFLFFTITFCGSLPCGPYINNKIVTCAVCSK